MRCGVCLGPDESRLGSSRTTTDAFWWLFVGRRTNTCQIATHSPERKRQSFWPDILRRKSPKKFLGSAIWKQRSLSYSLFDGSQSSGFLCFFLTEYLESLNQICLSCDGIADFVFRKTVVPRCIHYTIIVHRMRSRSPRDSSVFPSLVERNGNESQ